MLTLAEVATERVLRVSRQDLRSALCRAGAILRFENADLHCCIPRSQLEELIPYAKLLKAAGLTVAPIRRIIFESQGCRPIGVAPDVDAGDSSLIERDSSIDAKVYRQNIQIVNSRCRVMIENCQSFAAILDRNAIYIDLNSRERVVGTEKKQRSMLINQCYYDCFPQTSFAVHAGLREAFAYTEVPCYQEFTCQVGATPRLFRSKFIAYGEEVLVVTDDISPY